MTEAIITTNGIINTISIATCFLPAHTTTKRSQMHMEKKKENIIKGSVIIHCHRIEVWHTADSKCGMRSTVPPYQKSNKPTGK